MAWVQRYRRSLALRRSGWDLEALGLALCCVRLSLDPHAIGCVQWISHGTVTSINLDVMFIIHAAIGLLLPSTVHATKQGVMWASKSIVGTVQCTESSNNAKPLKLPFY